MRISLAGPQWRMHSAVVIAGLFVIACPRYAPAQDGAARPSSQDLLPYIRNERCDRARFRIVIDVGHTVEAPGATSARGVAEYAFNLVLAREIDRVVTEAGFVRTLLLITAGPARPALFARVDKANKARAHLFLSIHHDSVPEGFKSLWEFAGAPQRYSDRFKGHSIFISNDNADRPNSLRFARALGRQLKSGGLQYTPHYTKAEMGRWRRDLIDTVAGVYRYDRLVVLRMTKMPAVLLEAGSIVHRDEEILAASPERHALIGAAVLNAIEEFCASKARAGPQRQRQARGGSVR